MSDPVQQSGVRRRAVLIGAAAVVVVAVVAALVLSLRSGDDDGAAAADSSPPATAADSAATTGVPVATSSSAPTAVPATTSAPVDPDASPPTLAPVALDAEAQSGTGVSAQLTSVESVTSEASGPGNVSGPALRITVRVANGTTGDLSLDSASVNLAYGADDSPASPLDDSAQRSFGGTLAPGDSAEGVYVFSVPAGQRGPVTVELGYSAGAPVLVFRGPVD